MSRLIYIYTFLQVCWATHTVTTISRVPLSHPSLSLSLSPPFLTLSLFLSLTSEYRAPSGRRWIWNL